MTDNSNEQAMKIQKLNDLARTKGYPHLASRFITQGVAGLPSHERAQIMLEIVKYNNWQQGDDPYHEHDFGVIRRVVRNGVIRWTAEPQTDKEDFEKVYFKIDYYAKPEEGENRFTYGSENPADASITDRVMTVMCAEEY